MPKPAHTLEHLKTLLSYDPATGLFRWLVTSKQLRPGMIAGILRKDGYVLVAVGQRQYRANRLAWWFMTGEQPPKHLEVDHKNRNRADNRWENLRLATYGQNAYNTKTRSDNTSGHSGVYLSRGKVWFARIYADKRMVHLGMFDSFDEALVARQEAEVKYFGEFAP